MVEASAVYNKPSIASTAVVFTPALKKMKAGPDTTCRQQQQQRLLP
jgi:hypothetical protein